MQIKTSRRFVWSSNIHSSSQYVPHWVTDHPRRAQEAGGGGRRLARERGDDRAGQQEEPLCRDVPPQQGERLCRVDIYPLIYRVEFLHFDIATFGKLLWLRLMALRNKNLGI